MKKRILMIVMAIAAMLASATATNKYASAAATVPICPPFCAAASK